jgi:hypothetical protein
MPIETFVKSDDGNTYRVPTIEHEGGLWLVPEWIGTPYPKMPAPKRIIRMDSLAHMDMGLHPHNRSLHLYSLNDQIPKAVLDGLPSPQAHLFDVVEAPNLFVRR